MDRALRPGACFSRAFRMRPRRSGCSARWRSRAARGPRAMRPSETLREERPQAAAAALEAASRRASVLRIGLEAETALIACREIVTSDSPTT